MDDTSQTVKICDCCGFKNPPEASRCKECFAGLEVPDSGLPKPKSKTMAVILTLLFGPLGLLYLGLEGLFVIIFVAGATLFLLPVILSSKIGLPLGVLIRVGSAIWAVRTIDQRQRDDPDDANAVLLLDEAARLEGIDVSQAIAKYEAVASSFPNTREGREAERNVRLLKNKV